LIKLLSEFDLVEGVWEEGSDCIQLDQLNFFVGRTAGPAMEKGVNNFSEKKKKKKTL
jgi:hypothetical protein